jgi:4-hydroxy-L-threonine phosphate dehydrogenase PdxA
MLLITEGDPSSISPEIIVKSLKKLPLKIREKIILIGEEKSLKKYGFNSNLCSFLPTTIPNFKLIKGPNRYGGEISFKFLEIALKILKSKRAKALVTGPISKKAWDLASIKYCGHTEYFRSYFKKDLLMSFVNDKIKTALILEHIPLSDVSRLITKNLIIKKSILFKALLKKLKCSDKIFIAGINPHCGDGGFIGDDEIKKVIPAIRTLRRKGIKVFGPYNPEDVFDKAENNQGGGLFMYHDQLLGLIKIKYRLDIIHITFGLDFIRTSPTHGTAFDIAGKNIANFMPMYNAILKAYNMVENL